MGLCDKIENSNGWCVCLVRGSELRLISKTERTVKHA